MSFFHLFLNKYCQLHPTIVSLYANLRISIQIFGYYFKFLIILRNYFLKKIENFSFGLNVLKILNCIKWQLILLLLFLQKFINNLVILSNIYFIKIIKK